MVKQSLAGRELTVSCMVAIIGLFGEQAWIVTKRRRKKRTSRAQSSAALRQNGLNAFKGEDYQRAIDTWERVARQTPSMRPTSALAEAYFRRGVARLYGKSPAPEAGLNDLQKASELQPGDACYAYHQGLAFHRQGDPASAIRLYRAARQVGGSFAARAAYPLALALLQQGEPPAGAPVWPDLTAEEQAMLSQTGAFRRRPYALAPDAPPLWHTLVALDNDQHELAAAGLEQALAGDTNPAEKEMAHYYLGVLAARREDWERTRRHWGQIRSAGLDTPYLQDNLGELFHRLAEERLAGEDIEGALTAVEETNRFKPNGKKLDLLLSQVYQRLAHQAASVKQWKTALDHWESAVAADGYSFRLAYNLALAFEQNEDYVAAGEMWREALRRRPRRVDHPDAISDEQVARLWQRAADAYRRADEYEEAIRVYRQAVKWNPDNIEARLALAEELLTDGRGQAAENELGRILERDPDNVPVLLRLGEVIAQGRSWWNRGAAIRHWERVLELKPHNAIARQLLVDHFRDLGESAESWGNYLHALEMYQKALTYQPDNSQTLATLGSCYFRANEPALARDHLDRALVNARADLDAYSAIIQAWIDASDSEQAWQVTAQAEAVITTIPNEFYLFQAASCLRKGWSDLARPWLVRAEEQAPPDVAMLMIIGEMAATLGAVEIGREYLQRALAAGYQPGDIHLLSGILDAKEENMRSAKKHWKMAERIARKTRDHDLAERIERARFIFVGPLSLFGRMAMDPGLDLPLPLLDLFADEDDDDEFFR
jgi:tetratricopeptide (TPR) repeat protein